MLRDNEFLPSGAIPEKWFLRRGKRRVMWIVAVDIKNKIVRRVSSFAVH
jgi:hypothetical protein